MKNKLIFIVVFMFLSANIFSQISEAKTVFPDSWLGEYQGTMYILSAKRNTIDSVDVKFEFSETEIVNRWHYKMTYQNTKFGEIIKDYEIVKPDSLNQNNYLLDEKDGIIIQSTLMGNTLYSNFIVSGTLQCSILCKVGDDLYFEVTTSKDEYTLSTQNSPKNNEQSFIVDSYPPFTTQFVRFVKIQEDSQSE